MYQIRNIIIPISEDTDLQRIVSAKLGIRSVENIKILRRSLDARKKNDLKFNYTVTAEISDKYRKHPDIKKYENPQPFIKPENRFEQESPFIIGAGPAGLFAAISLVERGFKPYIFDRGEKIEDRTGKVKKFWNTADLDENSNVQFGEGGAGTFSDGKLTSRSRNYYTEKVLEYLIGFGAEDSIKIDALPHLGTDNLKKIVINMRRFLEDKGCRFFWNHKLENIEIENEKVKSVTIAGEIFSPECLIVAIGNSARDTFRMLSGQIKMENKPFAVGVRIEHPQDFINSAFYGERTDFSMTGPASYRLTEKYKQRGIYSFCMCPGGFIVAAASKKGNHVLNGMSYRARDGKYANSGIVATLDRTDFGKEILSGMEFQSQIEADCFKGNKPYYAPAQKADDFISEKLSHSLPESSYRPGIINSHLENLFPKFISEALKYALKRFDKRTPGFIHNGLLLAPETRTSSPVRMIRDKITFQAEDIENMFPVGEGSGYSGGIISSAADGYKLGCSFFDREKSRFKVAN